MVPLGSGKAHTRGAYRHLSLYFIAFCLSRNAKFKTICKEVVLYKCNLQLILLISFANLKNLMREQGRENNFIQQKPVFLIVNMFIFFNEGYMKKCSSNF